MRNMTAIANKGGGPPADVVRTLRDTLVTENLIIDSLNCTEIVEYIKNVIEEVKEFPKAEIKNKAKSTFLMIAATQNPLRGSASAFLSSCYDKIDKESPKFKKISEFIKNNIK